MGTTTGTTGGWTDDTTTGLPGALDTTNHPEDPIKWEANHSITHRAARSTIGITGLRAAPWAVGRMTTDRGIVGTTSAGSKTANASQEGGEEDERDTNLF